MPPCRSGTALSFCQTIAAWRSGPAIALITMVTWLGEGKCVSATIPMEISFTRISSPDLWERRWRSTYCQQKVLQQVLSNMARKLQVVARTRWILSRARTHTRSLDLTARIASWTKAIHHDVDNTLRAMSCDIFSWPTLPGKYNVRSTLGSLAMVCWLRAQRRARRSLLY
ncbi:hypothetical protein BDV93DRAFT_82040 [Ceratobasidium sp. AG-I]|nr:hypothetical protein BDV93DRAFT_82040 [Ceratobasidium sp. AG-I]